MADFEDTIAPMRFSASILREVSAGLFLAAGSPSEEAATVSRLLVKANLAGHDSHGVVRIPQYLRNLRRGLVVPGATATTVSDHGAAVRLSANHGYGQTAALAAMKVLLERASAHNAAAVGMSEMNHMGRLSDYCAQGAEQGVLTLMFAASSGFNSLVAPFGGGERRMNTNPFAVGIPGGRTHPLVFDIATSAASQGMLKVKADSGETIAPDLVIDRAGHPTTDPMDFYRGGAILPFGGAQGYKGYLLNFLVEVLGGILTDGGFMGHPKREAGGQCILAIGLKVAAFRESDAFAGELEALIAYLKATRTRPGMEILAPGESSHRTRQRRSREGIVLPAVTVAAIQEELDHYGVSSQLANQGMESGRTEN